MSSKIIKKAVLRIDASQPMDTPAGRLLGKMYYGSFLQNSLKDDEYSGYPNNGPEHTLRLHLTLDDLKSFLDLVIETFKSPAAEEFVQSVMRGKALNPFDVAAMQNIGLKGMQCPAVPAEQSAETVAKLVKKGAIMGAAYDFRDAHISGGTNLKRRAHVALESVVDAALTEQSKCPVAWRAKDANGRWMYGDLPAPELPADAPQLLCAFDRVSEPAQEVIELSGKQRIYLAQAWAMLEDYAQGQRSVGNNSIADSADASANEIKAMLTADPKGNCEEIGR